MTVPPPSFESSTSDPLDPLPAQGDHDAEALAMLARHHLHVLNQTSATTVTLGKPYTDELPAPQKPTNEEGRAGNEDSNQQASRENNDLMLLALEADDNPGNPGNDRRGRFETGAGALRVSETGIQIEEKPLLPSGSEDSEDAKESSSRAKDPRPDTPQQHGVENNEMSSPL